MRLGHVVIAVNDFDELMGFYRDTVGLQVSDVGTGGGLPHGPRMAFLTSDRDRMHHELALVEIAHPAGTFSVLNHVAFEVDDLDTLRAVWARVMADPRAGGLGPGGPATAFQGDQWSIRFSDPERNGVEVYTPTPWDVVAAATPYTHRTDSIFEPFELGHSDADLETWGRQHLTEMGLDHWPRGQRPPTPR